MKKEGGEKRGEKRGEEKKEKIKERKSCLEAAALLESHDIVAVAETRWDKSCDWNAAIDGYGPFRRDRRGRGHGGVALYVKQGTERGGMSLKNSQEEAESLWVGVRGRGDAGNLAVGAHHRPPDQGEPAGEAAFPQLQEDTCQTRSLIGTLDFRKANHRLFRELVTRTLPPRRETVLGVEEGAERRWQISKGAFHGAQELSIPRWKKSSKKGRRPAGLSWDLLVTLKGKKELQGQSKRHQVPWGECGDAGEMRPQSPEGIGWWSCQAALPDI